MTPFRDLPLRQKLLVMTLTSSAAALVLASSGFLAWDIVRARSEIREDLEAQAHLVADNSAAPVTFADEQTAGETLALLRLRPRVVMSCLYDSRARLFATYQRDNGTSCPVQPPESPEFGWRTLELTVPVQSGVDRVGTLFTRRDLTDVSERLRVGLGTVAGLLTVSFIAAFLIAARIQRSIAAPLLKLADTARTISSTRDYSLRATTMSNDEVGTVVKSFNDMLDQINGAIDRERDANRLKDEFLATLSHELRTPLNAVLGWTRILRTTSAIEPATQQRALQSIERNANAQARLIEDLLEVSRIVTGKLRLHVAPIDLAAVIDAAAEIVRPAATAKQIRLEVDLRVRPAMTLGDPDRLQQVIWNLLSNAVKFTPPGGRISLSLTRGNGYHLSISDSGVGIDPAFLPHAFEAFRQADGTARREHGGLGLGLAIAKQLVELHGGTIRISSEGKGKGATVEIVLPSVIGEAAPRPADAGAVVHTATDDIDPSLLHNRRVLIVDDDEDARAVIEMTLRQYGADVVAASSAAEAIDALNRSVPDVLLSDIGMAHEDGLMLLRRVRSRTAAEGGQVPAVAVTAYASARDRDAAASAGYQAHVAKPFDPHELARVVARLAGATTARPM